MESSARNLRLVQITPEHQPEALIEIIQNRAGNIPREEREASLVELIRRFQFLIRKVQKALYFDYDLGKKYNYDQADFMQDVLTEFIDLVTQDFKIKDGTDDTGLAVFGSYIKVKLYRRVQYKLQERLRKSGYGAETTVDYTLADGIIWDEGSKKTGDVFTNEVRQAVVANSLHYDDMVLNHMTDNECNTVLNELIDISNDPKVLDERDRKVWGMYYLSGAMVGEIGQHIPSKIGEEGKTIGRSRVLQIARDANDRIIREFGRRSAIRRVAL